MTLPATSPTIRATLRSRAAAALLCACTATLAACSDDATGPADDAGGSFLLATYLPTEGPLTGSSFFQATELDQTDISNANAFETTPFAYTFVFGNDVIVTQHVLGDEVVRYVRGADGRLAEAGRLTVPGGSGAYNVVYASPTKAYLALQNVGRIVVFDPQTMRQTGAIDLTTLGIARNPANPEDRNPDPTVMAIRDGKLYVALWQVTTSFLSADGADVAVFDVATDRFESVTSDPRAATPGRPGYNESMFVDEKGDLYVSCIASFGFVPGQRGGLLRIRRGQTTFDPSYFFDLAAAGAGVPGGRADYFNGLLYTGGGTAYGTVQASGLFSDPPDFVRDRAYPVVRLDLAARTLEVLPLPRGNGYSTAVARVGDRILFGLAADAGTGFYAYDTRTGEGGTTPVIRTVGSPSALIPFE
jgi:hypothetical protein